MLHLLVDENFNGAIVRGLLHRRPEIMLNRVQDVGLQGANDPEILAWAAEQNYILLTHDRATVPDFAFERILAGKPMPSVFVMNDRLSLRQAIDEILLLDECSEQDASAVDLFQVGVNQLIGYLSGSVGIAREDKRQVPTHE